MNRRSFIQRCFAGVAGAVAVFVPGKEKFILAKGTVKGQEGVFKLDNTPFEMLTNRIEPLTGHTGLITFNETEPIKCWFQPQTEPLTEGMEPPPLNGIEHPVHTYYRKLTIKNVIISKEGHIVKA